MDIKVLKYFVQVAKDQSYTRAAEHLFLSHPALSKLIKKLERELKVPLFRVQKNGVYLTDYGEQFYRRVVPIISEFDSLSAFVETMHSAPVGRLKLGVTPMIASLYVVDIVTNFNRQWPDIELQLIEDGSRALRKMLLDGSLDLALGITGASFPDLQDTVLFKDEMVVIASVDNPLSRYDSVTFEQLENQKFNLYTYTSALSHQITERCVKAGFLPKVNISSSKVNFMLQMTECDRGICILPRPYAVQSHLSPKVKIIYLKETFPWEGTLMQNGNTYKTYIVKLFERFVVRYFEQREQPQEKTEI